MYSLSESKNNRNSEHYSDGLVFENVSVTNDVGESSKTTSALRLRGGGETDENSESEFEDDLAFEMDIEDDMPEERLRSILLEAGYTTEEVNAIIATKEENTDSPNSTTSEPEISGTEAEEKMLWMF